MHGAVAATGLRFEKMGALEAAELECLSILQRLKPRDRLSRRPLLSLHGSGGERASRDAEVVAEERLAVG